MDPTRSTGGRCGLSPAGDADEGGIGEMTGPMFAVRAGTAVAAAAGYQVWPNQTAHLCVGFRGLGAQASIRLAPGRLET